MQIKPAPHIMLISPDGARATVHTHGAHLTSWQPSAKLGEQLFVSDAALFEPGTAIRGGVPVCFPQFAAFGTLVKHGFARTAQWALVDQTANTCTLRLTETNATMAIWPFPFQLDYRVSVSSEALDMQLTVTNTGQATFSFGAALHTYFRVNDFTQATVKGLKGFTYWDNGTPYEKRSTADTNTLVFDGPIDRVYFDAARAVSLVEDGLHKTISAEGFGDVVIWNPGTDDAQKMQDMHAHEHQQMLCIEAAIVDQPIPLSAGNRWTGSQQVLIMKK